MVKNLAVVGLVFMLGACSTMTPYQPLPPVKVITETVEVEIKQNGTILGSVKLEYEDFDTVESNFEIEVDFVIRSVTDPFNPLILGQLATSIDFTFNKKISRDYRGTRSTSITNLDTSTASSLSVLATVTGVNSSIQSTLAYLRKQY